MGGFGVSIGDVIALCILAKDIIISLKDSTGSSNQYLNAIAGLRGLELAFQHVQKCHDRLTDKTQKAALRQVTAECKESIDDFLCNIAKYHGHLSTTGTKNGFKDAFRKIQWRFCKTEDLESLHQRIDQHLQSIQILLVNYQLSNSSLDEQLAINKTLLSHENALSRIKQSSGMITTSLNTLTTIAYRIYYLCKQSADSMFVIKQLLRAQNNQIEQLRKIQDDVPAQILFSQPVILTDAFDQPLPFHLETVNSKAILMAILQERYKDAGLQKLRSGEYAIEDTIVNQDIDLDRPWHLCFRAGDRKAMSFEFPDPASSEKVCPFCQHGYVGEDAQLIKCTRCTRYFRRIEETETHVILEPSLNVEAGIGSTSSKPGRTAHDTPHIPADKYRNDRIQDFARVRLKRRNSLLSLTDLISAKRVAPDISTIQVLGQMSDATLQRLSRNRGVAGRKYVGKVTHQSGTVANFEDYYGAGYKLN